MLLPGVYRTISLLSIRFQSFFVCVCFPPTIFLICWLTSSDASFSALRALSMAGTVSVGTLSVVEELVVSPSSNRTSPTSAAAEKSPVVGLATLECVSFSLSKIVTDVEATSFR